MTLEKIWAMVRESALRERESYLDAWRGTGNVDVLKQIKDQISRLNAFKGASLTNSLETDHEGVRLALICAESWHASLADSQVGQEKILAAGIARRVTDIRMRLFGKTWLEATTEKSVAMPIHQVADWQKSGLTASEFLSSQR